MTTAPDSPNVSNKRNRRRLWLGVLAVLLGLGIWQGLYWARYLHLASGYAAKVAASGVFVAGRDLEQLRTHELKPFAILDVEVDEENREVHVSAFGLFGQTARHRPGLGATLVHDDSELSGPARLESAEGAEAIRLPESSLDRLHLASLNQSVEFAFRDLDPEHPWNTRAVVILQNGEVLIERYGDSTGPDTLLHGWSMTKTVTGVLCGLAVKDGRLRVESQAPVPGWEQDGRSAITLEHLLRMTTGLDFEESYSKPGSDALRMLFDSHDMPAFVATRPLEHAPGSNWSYSSGDSLLLSGILRRTYGEANFEFARDRLFAKVGMHSARLEFDGAGNAVGSSMCWANARDWARFGEFLREGGRVADEQIVPEGWIDWMATPTPESENGSFGAHLWVNAGVPNTNQCAWPSVPRDLFWCAGFEGQFVVVAPSRNAVIVRLGQTFGEPTFPIEPFVAGVLSALPD